MKSLFLFLYKFRAFITLILLESLCAFLIIQNSQYHRALYFNSSNTVIGSVLSVSNNVTQYFRLEDINESLASENATLKNNFREFSELPDSIQYDSTRKFNYLRARIIDNSVDLRNNIITIDVGAKDGIKKDMAVIGGGGIIGKTRYISNNFTLVTSLLHTSSMVPALVKDKVNICTVQWDGTDPYIVDLLYVPRHYSLVVGDTVLTSGYSGIFPENLTIGYISSIDLSDDEPFFNIKVKLANDFYKVAYVEVAESVNLPEIDSLQNLVQ
jgi:rod shape-determining protein MreC